MTEQNRFDVYTSRKQTTENLRTRSQNVRRYLEDSKSTLDPVNYQSLIDGLDSFDQASSSILWDFYKAREYGFSDEEKYSAMTSGEIAAERAARADAAAADKKDHAIVWELSQTLMPYDWSAASSWGYTNGTRGRFETTEKVEIFAK